MTQRADGQGSVGQLKPSTQWESGNCDSRLRNMSYSFAAYNYMMPTHKEKFALQANNYREQGIECIEKWLDLRLARAENPAACSQSKKFLSPETLVERKLEGRKKKKVSTRRTLQLASSFRSTCSILSFSTGPKWSTLQSAGLTSKSVWIGRTPSLSCRPKNCCRFA